MISVRWGVLAVALTSACLADTSPVRDAGLGAAPADAAVVDVGDVPLDAGGAPDAPPLLDAGDFAECGNGELEPGERCDDGNTSELDDCANDCTPAAPFYAFDQILTAVLERYDIAGATVAVTKDERLVLKRAYGLADRSDNRVMKRRDRMRIASLSKSITAVAILKMVEEGRLALSDRAFELLDDAQPPAGQDRDARLAQITIEHLLHHAGGWDRNASGDPMFRSRVISSALGIDGPASAADTLTYMLGQPLDFDPGTAYAYSNFGYLILGRVIEKVSGQSYEAFVRNEVLAPMGVHEMELGRSLAEDQPEDEVTYHLYEGARDGVSVFPQHSDRVKRPYGGWHHEAMDAHGGWIAHSEDLVRFLTAVDGRMGRVDLLDAQTTAEMVKRPAMERWNGRAWYYAMGWSVRPTRNSANWWHMGSLPGTSTLFLRSHHGFTWAVLTNGRTADGNDFLNALDAALWSAVESVNDWPEYDLFAD
jgi:N-acyl-D-amino-acid deacylase